MDAKLDVRVLVLMPVDADAEEMGRVLAGEEIAYSMCQDMDELSREIRQGAAAALVAEEAMEADRAGSLADVLRDQPQWSDFPLVVFARDEELGHPIREWMNATLVERPIRIRPLLSVVRAALRSRRHQYEVRDHLLERKQAEKVLEESRQRLATVLDAARMATWDWNLTTDEAYASESATEVLGLVPGKSFCSQRTGAAASASG